MLCCISVTTDSLNILQLFLKSNGNSAQIEEDADHGVICERRQLLEVSRVVSPSDGRRGIFAPRIQSEGALSGWPSSGQTACSGIPRRDLSFPSSEVQELNTLNKRSCLAGQASADRIDWPCVGRNRCGSLIPSWSSEAVIDSLRTWRS